MHNWKLFLTFAEQTNKKKTIMKKMSYIGGKTTTQLTNPTDLPMGTIIDVANPQTEFYRSSYHWVRFEKIDDDCWGIKSVWYVNETKTYQEVKSDTRYTTNEVMKLACKTYKFDGKEFRSNDYYILIPLIDNNGNMNCLIMENSYVVRYSKNVSTLKLLQECADYYSRTYIKFRYDNKEDMTINIEKGNMKYLITCTETEFDDYCQKNNLNIKRHSFNTYL